jgi:hypothetical protein
MECRIWASGLVLILLCTSSARLAADPFVGAVRAPAVVRLDFTRPGGLPGYLRDVDATQTGHLRVEAQDMHPHKRLLRAH